MLDAAQSSTVRVNVAFASAVALAWIAVAHVYRHPADQDPVPVQWALSVLGIWFVACGVWAYTRVQIVQSDQLLFYCALSGVHWGGPIGLGPSVAQSVELVFYVVFGTVLPQAALLDLARRLRSGKAPVRFAPYVPVLVGALLLFVYLATRDRDLLTWFSSLYLVGILS